MQNVSHCQTIELFSQCSLRIFPADGTPAPIFSIGKDPQSYLYIGLVTVRFIVKVNKVYFVCE